MAKLNKYKSVKDFTINGLDLDGFDSWLITFKNKLKKIIISERKRRNMSQSDLAKLLGTTQSVVSRIETGLSKNITIDYLLKVITALGISPKEAMEDVA
ncbi:MAG: helix-turn-helix domain-containing protein [Bacteriovoracaceae bacterium]|nr:helix-turn-helix domain-containing protein [Bacteriovoracaceae bacterium]